MREGPQPTPISKLKCDATLLITPDYSVPKTAYIHSSPKTAVSAARSAVLSAPRPPPGPRLHPTPPRPTSPPTDCRAPRPRPPPSHTPAPLAHSGSAPAKLHP